MNDIAFAVAVHILSIVWWIGGVAIVTTVFLPAARRLDDATAGIAMFQRIEERFAWHARAATLLAAASGYYMVAVLRLWPHFSTLEYWWLDAMVPVWAMLTIALLVAEPLFAHRWLERRAVIAPTRTLILLQRLHWIALTLSNITILGAGAGGHGLAL